MKKTMLAAMSRKYWNIFLAHCEEYYENGGK
jgi:hypothetical protein